MNLHQCNVGASVKEFEENPLSILSRCSSTVKEKTEPKGGPKPTITALSSASNSLFEEGTCPQAGAPSVGVGLPVHTSHLNRP